MEKPTVDFFRGGKTNSMGAGYFLVISTTGVSIYRSERTAASRVIISSWYKTDVKRWRVVKTDFSRILTCPYFGKWKEALKLCGCRLEQWKRYREGGRERYGKRWSRICVCMFVCVFVQVLVCMWGFPAATGESWWSNSADKWTIKLTWPLCSALHPSSLCFSLLFHRSLSTLHTSNPPS